MCHFSYRLQGIPTAELKRVLITAHQFSYFKSKNTKAAANYKIYSYIDTAAASQYIDTLSLFFIIFLPCHICAGKKQKQAQEQKGHPQTPQDEDEDDRDSRCTPWSYSECEPLDGECGKGIKIGSRSGPKCKKTEKEKDCRVPCGEGGGKGGKKKGGRQKQKDQPRPYEDPDEEEEVEVNGKTGKKSR